MGYQGGRKIGFILPTPIVPSGTVCVKFEIPDAPEYRRALIGTLYELGKWNVWEKSGLGDTRAKQAAELWREILYATLEIGVCDMPFELRQSTTDPCLLEQSLDGGVTWAPAFDYSLCAGKGEPIIRFTPDGDMEVSYDDGETWQSATSEDPRINPPMLPPLTGMDDNTKRCIAATNAAGNFKLQVDDQISDAGAWGAITGVIGMLVGILVFVGIIGSGGALAPLLITAAAAIMGAGAAGLDAAFTSAVWDTIKCKFYCNFEVDGTISDAGVNALKIDLDTEIGGLAALHMINLINLVGAGGMNNMARTAQSAIVPPCSSCVDCGECGDGSCAQDEILINWETNQDMVSGGSGFAPYSGYGIVYYLRDEILIDLGAERCVVGVKINGTGSSAISWAGWDLFVDNNFAGHSAAYSGDISCNGWLQGSGAGKLLLDPNRAGRYLRIAGTGIAGSNTSSFNVMFTCIRIRVCTL